VHKMCTFLFTNSTSFSSPLSTLARILTTVIIKSSMSQGPSLYGLGVAGEAIIKRNLSAIQGVYACKQLYSIRMKIC